MFDTDYNNPCWAESIPRWPYQNNSYLLIDDYQKLIDPAFQAEFFFTLLYILKTLIILRLSGRLSVSFFLSIGNDSCRKK